MANSFANGNTSQQKLFPKASHFDVNFARRLVTRRRETSFARRRETYRKSSRDVLEISHGPLSTSREKMTFFEPFFTFNKNFRMFDQQDLVFKSSKIILDFDRLQKLLMLANDQCHCV